jgi:hypothetical protein
MLLIPVFLLAIFEGARSQYPNFVIGTEGYPNEPSICISPVNPNQMVAGANTDNFYYSSDGGLIWDQGILSSLYGVAGDPVVIADTAGDFYYFHLSVPTGAQWLDRIVCQKSVNGGQTWSGGSYMGLNGGKDQDKEWAVVDPATNAIYACWTQFDKYGSSNPLDSTNILFSRSFDGGLTWSEARRINKIAGDCHDGDNTVEGAVPAVGPNGEIYVAWAGPEGLVFTKSTNQGTTWPEDNCFISDIPGGWDYMIPGISRANGLPVTCCDLSNGPYRGTIYVNWSDQRNGTSDTDIWIVKSTDGGQSWTTPKRVNDDPPGKQQFFTWMTIDRSTGYLYIVFYDRRNYSNNSTDVFLAVSTDGGENFVNFRVSESPFTPNTSVFFGDYTNIAAVNGIVRPIWARLHNGDISILTALVDSLFTGSGPQKEKPIPFSLEQNYPNPVHDITTISFRIHEPAVVSLNVYDIYGHRVAIMLPGTLLGPGRHIERFDRRQYGLPPGFYFYSLVSNQSSVMRKMILD